MGRQPCHSPHMHRGPLGPLPSITLEPCSSFDVYTCQMQRQRTACLTVPHRASLPPYTVVQFRFPAAAPCALFSGLRHHAHQQPAGGGGRQHAQQHLGAGRGTTRSKALGMGAGGRRVGHGRAKSSISFGNPGSRQQPGAAMPHGSALRGLSDICDTPLFLPL